MQIADANALRFLTSGDAAVTVQFGDKIDADINARVLAFDRALTSANVAGVVECVPTYRSLLVHYDPVVIGFAAICDRLREIAGGALKIGARFRKWSVPVVYGGAYGVDLEDVAKHHGVSVDEIIARHTASEYRVAMIGFTPGFAYLSGLDPSLATPRRQSPRTETPSGTISIGGQQACVQCLAGPSGWHLLGRTPVRTFHPTRDPMFLMEPGDAVVFTPIDERKFETLDRAAAAGEPVAELLSS